MKEYTVYFVIKKNNHGWLKHETVSAANQKEAIKAIKRISMYKYNRYAFYCTCKTPVKTNTGVYFNGMCFTRYSEIFGWLW